MVRYLAGFCVLAALLAQGLTARAADEPAPSFAKAMINKNGQVEIIYSKELPVYETKENGETTTRMVIEKRMSINDIQIVLLRQVDGKKVEAADVAKRLAKRTPVLLLPEGAELNADHAPLFKPDALILSIMKGEPTQSE